MTENSVNLTVSQRLSNWAQSLDSNVLPAIIVDKNRDILVDVVGLCVAARHQEYLLATKAAAEQGDHIIIGHAERCSPSSAALINGTAGHGEDFDDTFVGGPVHSGVVLIPALLATAQSYKLGNDRTVLGLAAGAELLCRLALTLPKAVHNAGFHPTAVLGGFAAVFGICVACEANEKVTVNALGIVGSMASGIIEYLGDGSWTKRMHPGWAAQSAIRAYAMAKAGFKGPKAVFEGRHGVFNTFAHSIEPRTEQLFADLGNTWVSEKIAFKPYPCGGMIHPYIDCAIQLRDRGVDLNHIDSIVCKTAEGIVHRLWTPLEIKRQPPTTYAAKFSTPFGVALGLVRGHANLDDFSEAAIQDEDLLKISQLVEFEIDPSNPYPELFTGHVRIVYKDGRTEELEQRFIRGGADAPLSRQELEKKFQANASFGKLSNWGRMLEACDQIGYRKGNYMLIRELAG